MNLALIPFDSHCSDYHIKWRSNNVLNVIIVQKKIPHTKSSVGQHAPPTKAKAGSGAMEE